MGKCSSHLDCLDSSDDMYHPDLKFCHKTEGTEHEWLVDHGYTDGVCLRCPSSGTTESCDTCRNLGVDGTCGYCDACSLGDRGDPCSKDADCGPYAPICSGWPAQTCKTCSEVSWEACRNKLGNSSPMLLTPEHAFSAQQVVIMVLVIINLLTVCGVICKCLRSRCGAVRRDQKYQVISMDKAVAEESQSENAVFEADTI